MDQPVSTRERYLLPELSKYIFRQFPLVLYTTFLLSALIVLVLWDLFPSVLLLSWLGVLYAINSIRFVLHCWYWRRSEKQFTPKVWLRLYSLGALTAGCAWAAAPLLFYSRSSPETNVFIAFVLGGLIAGASSSTAPLRVTVQVLIALFCLPIATLFFLHGDNLQLVMGAMMLVYGVAYVAMSANTARTIADALTLRNENLHEIEERRKAEAELRKIQQDLEKTVAQRTEELRTANADLSREIEERMQIESKLRVSEESFRTLVESSSDWIWETDRDGAYTYSSPSIFAVLGYTAEQVVGRRFCDLMPPEETQRVNSIFESNRSTGKSFERLVNRCLHKDGTERVMETSGEPVFDETGAVIGFRGIDRDITLRIRREEERRKIEHLESLGLLAGGIAHDFNNLLTSIFGNIEMARTAISADSDAGEALADGLAAMEQARKLTGQLLTFSKGGSLVLEMTSIRDLIADSCRRALSGTSVKCEYDVPADLWMADVDPGQIWQVFNNILTNAREAMPDGGTVWVSAKNVTRDNDSTSGLEPGNYVEISVRDHGVGVSKNNITRVFDPYYSTKFHGEQKGTGIGLAVCHSIIKKHGGHITLESEVGRGTTVTFFLPAGRVQPLPKSEGEREPNAPLTGFSVLMLEDDLAVTKTAVRILEHLGLSVSAVETGSEVLDLYARARQSERPFDFVLLDLTIRGGMSGRETLERLKKMDPDVVAVVTSGYAEDPVMAEFGQHGFRAALAKPFSIKTLRQTIADLNLRPV